MKVYINKPSKQELRLRFQVSLIKKKAINIGLDISDFRDRKRLFNHFFTNRNYWYWAIKRIEKEYEN